MPRPPAPRPPVDAGLVAALAVAGWTVRERPGAPEGVVASDEAGTVCVIRRVGVPAAPDARAALTEHLRVLAHDHEHLVPVRAVVEAGDTTLVVLTDHVDGLPLDELAAVREPFTAAEAVTVLVPVAQALAALHRTGRSHGRLDARSVVVSPGGRAVVHPPLAPAAGSPADDVRDLARVVLDLVPPPASSHPAQSAPTDPDEVKELAALHAELVVALRDDPSARPAAGTFAARCYDAVEPRPVTMPDAARLVAGALGARRRAAPAPSATPPAPAAPPVVATAGGSHRPSRVAGRAGRHGARTPGRRGRLRAVLTSLGIVVACAALVVAFLALDGSPAPRPGGTVASAADGSDGTGAGSGPDATTDPADPTAAARALTERRLALVTEGTGDLSGIDVPGSPAEATDAALLAELEGVDVLEARAEVFDARVVEPGPGGAGPAPPDPAADVPVDVAVEVDYAVGAHRQRTEDGELQVSATPRTTVLLVLRWTDAGWRVAEVR
jgi:hypothetical protein